jgi:hypothetical protein
MRIQTLTGIFPTTERPLDPKNGSHGAVATATRVDVQTVLRRTTTSRPKIVSQASPATPARPAASLRIVIDPRASGRKWTARLGRA